jgi:hypothetical protein
MTSMSRWSSPPPNPTLQLTASSRTFSIQVDAARVNRLGRLFDELRSWDSGWFRWTPAEDDVHVDGSHEAA